MKPDEKDLLDNIGKIAYTLDKAYLSRLTSDYGVLYFEEKYNKKGQVHYSSNIRALKVERWVFDQEQLPGDCFKNVLNLFADGDHTIALVVKRKPTHTEMYFVVKNEGLGRNEDSRSNIELLNHSLKGNFPGTSTKIIDEIDEVEELFRFEEETSISVLVNTPSHKTKDYITQGLDKLLNGIVPEEEDDSYTIVFLAESLAQSDIREILSGYEDIATAIIPFLQYQFQIGKNETDTKGEMKSITNTESISNSIFKTHSINIGMNSSLSSSRATSTSTSKSAGVSVNKSAGASAAGVSVGKSAGISMGVSRAISVVNTLAKTLGISSGYGYSWGESKTITSGESETSGTNSSISLGTSENTSYTYKSYMVQNLLKKLEQTMERIDESQATGLWKFATYVLAKESKVSESVANYMRSITQGDESYLEPSVIQEWSYEESNGYTVFNEIKKYVAHFTHPIFVTNNDASSTMMVTPTAYVGTNELSYVIAFPRKSLQGLPVLECVQFGREPHSLLETSLDLDIGCAYHMHQAVNNQRIVLSKQELTKHTFITGSTGSGKSNTIYRLLQALEEQNVKFLVIEPAKGEYKKIFGQKEDVTVYGTNPNLKDIEMLRINPFRFPSNVHVLEHMDRLVEIFNVCWPMYAAMPAILKDAIERAYVMAGWDLTNSTNRYDDNLYPTFSDVLIQIKKVLNESDYSDDNKGDYTGSLVTRLRSLTNGINGLIFTTDDISDECLFDENVIIDLSRVGSSETKALIMGLLVVKLQEYRMKTQKSNESIQHVTVLEEAHNLLKRTSAEQSSEGANLLGKSVEMLANAIAEMRTYGEGFIIADQSPGLLDMSVIRNTNTKMILRLPDFSDRELVGKASGLNDKQIIELGRLEKGVACITQSDWLEPVLCKIDKYDEDDNSTSCSLNYDKKDSDKVETDLLKQSILECIMKNEIYRVGDRVDIEGLRHLVVKSKLPTVVKCEFIEYITADSEKAVEILRKFTYDFFSASEVINASKECDEITLWTNKVIEMLNPSIKGYSEEQITLVLALIVYEQVERDISYRDLFCRFTEMYKEKGSVF